jgi:hypothetical protein
MLTRQAADSEPFRVHEKVGGSTRRSRRVWWCSKRWIWCEKVWSWREQGGGEPRAQGWRLMSLGRVATAERLRERPRRRRGPDLWKERSHVPQHDALDGKVARIVQT